MDKYKEIVKKNNGDNAVDNSIIVFPAQYSSRKENRKLAFLIQHA